MEMQQVRYYPEKNPLGHRNQKIAERTDPGKVVRGQRDGPAGLRYCRAIAVPRIPTICVRPPVIPKSSSLIRTRTPSPSKVVPSVLPTICGRSAMSAAALYSAARTDLADVALLQRRLLGSFIPARSQYVGRAAIALRAAWSSSRCVPPISRSRPIAISSLIRGSLGLLEGSRRKLCGSSTCRRTRRPLSGGALDLEQARVAGLADAADPDWPRDFA